MRQFRPAIFVLLLLFPAAPRPGKAAEPADLVAKAAGGSAKTVDHAAWDRLLKTYVKHDVGSNLTFRTTRAGAA